MDLEFSDDWATSRFPKWAEVLARFKGQPTSALELGSHEGRSAIWFLQNILTDPESRLICIDTWNDSNVYKRFLINLIVSDVFPRCDFLRGDTGDLVQGLRRRFDFIYIDADHAAPSVLADAVMAWRRLKTGGVLIFDDYPWQDPEECPVPPKVGIDAFLTAYEGRYELLHMDWQVIVQKV